MLEEGDVIVRPTDGWAAVGPRVRCFAIEDALMHLVDRRRLDAGCTTWPSPPMSSGS